MRRTLRWVRRIVLGVLAVLVVVLGIVIAALHTEWGREQVRAKIVDELRGSFPGGAKIGRLTGSVFGELVAHDVELDGADHKPFVTIKQVHIKLALLPLFGKTARIDELSADHVVVHARKQPEPAAPPPPGEPSEPSGWSIEMPQVGVHDTQIEIETTSSTETISDVDAMVALHLPARAPLFALVQATARWRGKDVTLEATVRRDDALHVPFAVLAVGDGGIVVVDAKLADGPTVAGAFAAHAPAALVESLAGVEPLGDATLLASSQRSGDVLLRGAVGGSQLYAVAKTDLANRSARAIVAAMVPDVAALSHGAVTGAGTVVATVAGNADHAGGLVSIVGEAEGQTASVLALFDATRDRAMLLAAAKAGKGTGAISADLVRTGGGWEVVRSELGAEAHDKRGRVDAHLTAHGQVWPERAVAITGTLSGKNLRDAELSAAGVNVRLEALIGQTRSNGTLQVQIGGGRRGRLAIPSATFAARGARDATGVVTIDLERHRVLTADGAAWTGTGGRVTITDDKVALDNLRTGTGASQITASATMSRTSDALTAKVSARDVALALVDPTWSGQLAADLDVARRGGRWSGSAKLDAKQVTLPKRQPIDGSLAVQIADRRLTAHGTAANPMLGSATFDLDVIGPADITDARAWRRVERSAIKNIRVALAKIDANQLGASGNVDGELAISATDAGGNVAVRGVQTSAGTLDSELVISRSPSGDIAARGTAHLAGLDPITVDASIALPQHPFDPDAWQQLGRGALRGATIEAKHLAFDPDIAKRFGVKTTARGYLATTIKIGPGAQAGDFVLDVHELTGLELAKPVEIHATGGVDSHGIHADVAARADTVGVAIAAKTSLTVDAALAGRALTTPIEVTVTVPKLAARDVGLLLHRNDVLGGVLGGTVTLSGTVKKPEARAQLAVENLVIAAGISRKPPTLEKLELDARWYGDRAELELTGFEAGGRLLKISARGQDTLATMVATIEAANFDLAPLAAFAPGQLSGARGIVGGVVKIKGFDPATGEVKGKLHISEGRVPLSAELGTLRDTEIDITIKKQEILALIDAKLGAGTIKGKAIARLLAGTPTAAELDLKLHKVSPIGAVQPVISANVSGWFARTKTKWAGKLSVKNGSVYVPAEAGTDLLGLGAPSDLIFIDAKTLAPKPARRPPSNPWLRTDVEIGRTQIVIEDKDFTFKGTAKGQLKLAVGDGIGLDGTLTTDSGNIDIVGRRYRLDHGVLDFDGTVDPRLDIELVHDFSREGLTLTADIVGRSSSPDVRLSSDPATYTQSQLLAILMGGDPAEGGQGAVVGGAAAIFSSRLAKKLTKRLPIKLDTINYETGTLSSSSAIKFGAQLTDRTYLLWRQRLEPRPDENPGEGVIEYQLSTSWLIEGTAGSNGGGADVMWRWRK